MLHSAMWILYLLAGLVIAMLVLAALPLPRKVTAQEFADGLEQHLLGTEGEWDWDDTTSIRIADKRLDQLRRSLPTRFDMLSRQEDRDELQAVIAALRHGEIPEMKPRRG